MTKVYRHDGLCSKCGLRTKRPTEGYCKPCRDDTNRAQTLKTKGITLARYEEMLAAQGGGCAICGTDEPGTKSFHIDHDHRCCPGKHSCGECVRGLLCMNCNHILGKCHDDPLVLKRALEYLGG